MSNQSLQGGDDPPTISSYPPLDNRHIVLEFYKEKGIGDTIGVQFVMEIDIDRIKRRLKRN